MAENQRIIAGRYEVGVLIGRGGMADVYEGLDTRLGRIVAIKVLKSDLANDPNFEARFRQEAQASARMAHPTIVRVYDAGEETDVDTNGNNVRRPYIVMEYVRGTLLRDLLHQRRLTVQEATDYAQGVLTALEFSHRAGVVHRDIKAANIMITEAGLVKVMDFGIARAVYEGSTTQAHTSGIVGTAQYFSPEQARGESVDSRTDLYSTGVLLYEMLAGRPPFRGETAVSVAYQHVSEAVTPPSVHNPELTAEFDAVVLKALAKDRNDRFQTAEEFRDALVAAAAGGTHAPAGVNRTVELEPIVAAEPFPEVEAEPVIEEQAAEPELAEAAADEPAEVDPFDEFEAMLRGASDEATDAIKTVEEAAVFALPVESLPAAEAIRPVVADLPAANEPDIHARVEAPVSAKRPSSAASSAAATEVFNFTETNPFATLGVDLGGSSSGGNSNGTGNGGGILRGGSNLTQKQAGLLWGIGSGLTVLVVGLLVWVLSLGPIDINITPTPSGIIVSDVTGKTYQDGYDALVAQKLLVNKIYEPSDTIPADSIVKTDPVSGTRVPVSTTINVYVSSGKAMVKLPNLTGKTEAEALAAIALAKLTLGSITPANSASVVAGTIISSDPPANTSVAEGSVVNLISSNGMVMVPDVTNLGISDAKNALTSVDVGLTVSVTTVDICAGTLGTIVQSQSISPGLTKQRSAIVLYVECLP